MKSAATIILFSAFILPMFWNAGEEQSGLALILQTPYEYGPAELSVKDIHHVTSPEAGMKENVRHFYLMGTSCTIQLYSMDSQSALKRIESLIRLLEDAEDELSTWKANSILSRLNKQPVGVPFEIDPSVYQLFETLLYWSEETNGAFDPTVGKLLNAYELRNRGEWPESKTLEIAKADKGMHFYDFDKTGYRITKTQDVVIDCGAFGKGEALDRLPKEDATNNRWLVNLGGQIIVNGSPPNNDGWQVIISHPQNRQEGFISINLRSGSLATSGGSERDVEVHKLRLGHIINPITGKPADFNGSVSVWHEQALVADILSTALYVMGPEKGLSWAESRNIAACFLIPDEGGVTVIFSRSFSNLFSLNRESFSREIFRK
ncbi:MAG: FAD:protein FMN transferase [Acidobacteriota bacterium]|jgi:thiamine biosynthesis lipoprotein